MISSITVNMFLRRGIFVETTNNCIGNGESEGVPEKKVYRYCRNCLQTEQIISLICNILYCEQVISNFLFLHTISYELITNSLGVMQFSAM